MTKLKLHRKLVKKSIISSSKTPNITSTETSVQEENKKNNHTKERPQMSKELKVVTKMENLPVQKTDTTQDEIDIAASKNQQSQ